MFYVYVLESLQDGSRYIGSTSDLRRRVEEHNQGKNVSTKKLRPWKIIYYEACLVEKDARRREGYLKTSQGHRLLLRRMKEYMYQKRYT